MRHVLRCLAAIMELLTVRHPSGNDGACDAAGAGLAAMDLD
ncbi:hypothetical protein [Poseidonocella sp. HB161398]|nr:hypothetical protein [Poseidonocella sp. HB161398]